MGAILSVIVPAHGLTRVYGGTFLQFAGLHRARLVRLAALQRVRRRSTCGPTTRSASARTGPRRAGGDLAGAALIPGLSIVVGDANQTAAAWKAILERRDGAVGLILTRQNVPSPWRAGLRTGRRRQRGAYVLLEASSGIPDVILVATGSEVQVAVAARESLEAEGIATRVVSAPSLQWFDAQDPAYRESVLPSSVRARVSVEVG